jgi:hypothetical protein
MESQGEGGRVLTADSFDEHGVLRPLTGIGGRLEPYSASLGQIDAQLVGASDERRHLFEHLEGFVDVLGLMRLGEFQLWLRGNFAAQLNVPAVELDLLLIADDRQLRSWLLRVLGAGRLHLHPGDMMLQLVPQHEPESVERERVRSSRRCTAPDGDVLVTGWIEITP